jgi:hypothetical protein
VVLEHHADLPAQERDLRIADLAQVLPASSSLPLVGRSMASNRRSKVLLPAPEWPVTNRNSPRRARKLSSCKPT